MRPGTLSIASVVMLLSAIAAAAQSTTENTERPSAEALDEKRTDESTERTEAEPRARDSASFTPSERIRADTVVSFPADI